MKNVKDYGAHGNGVDDDTDSILAALAACSAGEVCSVPLGIYMIRPSGLTHTGHAPAVLSGMRLVGESRKGSILKVSAMPTDTMLRCIGDEWLVADLTLDAGDFVPPVSLNAVSCNGNRWSVTDCDVLNIGRWGITVKIITSSKLCPAHNRRAAQF